MNKISNKSAALGIYLALALVTLAVFWQVGNHDFVDIDDPGYITQNEHVKAGLTKDGIIWAFTAGYASNWHPLTWLSHMLDCQLFGLDPDWHHLTNLLLHITNTLLLFAVLKQMTGALWRSAFVAAAFALHPVHVESVAWIAERKDVLSTLFWMLTMAAYLRYVKAPNISRYLLTLLAFALGLMAKPMLVTLPFVLLLLDYWPLNRFQPGEGVKNVTQRNGKYLNTRFQWLVLYRLVREKIPFFALTVISSIITFLVQQIGGAVATIKQVSLTIRIANVFISYVKYIGKMIWPSRLAVFYPHLEDRLSMWQAAVAALLLLAISIWVIRLARTHRYLPVGWLWYLGTLVPVIGLVQVGGQALADRYTYIPLTGLFIIIAWGLPELLAKWRYLRNPKDSLRRTPAGGKITLGALAMMTLLALSMCTYFQQRHWRNSITLFEHTLKVTNDNFIAHFCLARHLRKQGKIDQALAHNYEAVRIGSNFPRAYISLGITLFKADKLDEAITYLTKAVRLNPNSALARGHLAQALAQKGRINEAVPHFKEALRLKPDWVSPMNNLAWHLATHNETKFRDPQEAIRLAERACELTKYKDFSLLDTLAAAYAVAGRFSEAVATAEKALELAESSGQNQLTEDIRSHLLLYKAGQPYIQP